nr:hypothetical protein [Flavobacterium sp. ASV13]
MERHGTPAKRWKPRKYWLYDTGVPRSRRYASTGFQIAEKNHNN